MRRLGTCASLNHVTAAAVTSPNMLSFQKATGGAGRLHASGTTYTSIRFIDAYLVVLLFVIVVPDRCSPPPPAFDRAMAWRMRKRRVQSQAIQNCWKRSRIHIIRVTSNELTIKPERLS